MTILVTGGFVVYMWGCQVKTKSLTTPDKFVNRQELQLELDQVIGLAQLRMADLDQQEQFRAIILQNALILVQGQPFNAFGIISAVAALYGVTQAGSQVTRKVKSNISKRKANNGTS